MTLSKSSINNFLFIAVLLCSVHFFGLHYRFGNYAYDLIDLFYFSVALFFLMKFIGTKREYIIPRKDLLFTNTMLFFAAALIFSSISCLYYHDQSPLFTLIAMRYFLYFLIFFILVILGVDKKYLLKVCIIFAVFYMTVFMLQLILFPTAIVPLGNTTDFDRGFLRLRVEGVGFITLTGFYSLNRYLVNKKQLGYLFFYFLCFIFIFILGFRTLLATFLIASSFLLFLHNKSIVTRLSALMFVLVFGLLLSQISFVQDFIMAMSERTDEQLKMGQEYIRFLTFDFLFNKINVDWGSLIFGNGMPVEGSRYGGIVLGYGAKQHGFISADLGILGFIFNYGVIAASAFLYIFIKATLIKLPKDSVYLNAFFFYLIISSFTTAEIFRAGIFGVEMIGLYLIAYTNYEKKLTK